MLQLGVLIPTRNSMPYLPRHLAAMGEWVNLAAEVVVVDSFSNDGTLDYLRTHLAHPALRFLSHPPGLYESWNYGLKNLTTDYAYISTLGDTITREGLLHLLKAAQTFEADVVVSKPTFCREDGKAAEEPHLPIDDILSRRNADGPLLLRPLEMVIYAAGVGGGSLLGSSASNLYRANCLREYPFPTEYGPAGDGAWGLLHAHELRWCVSPGRFSTFLMHPKAHSPARTPFYPGHLLRATLEKAIQAGTLQRSNLERTHIPALLATNSRWSAADERLNRDRKGPWPWSLNPAAWHRRAIRNRLRRELKQLQEGALQTLA